VTPLQAMNAAGALYKQ